MAQLTFEDIQTLRTDQGRAALAAADGVVCGVVGPAVIERLRREFPGPLVAAALTLAEVRLRANDRFSRAAEMFFDSKDLMEQATSEPVAVHKAARFAGLEIVADLCCGAGGDSVAIARQASSVVAVDRSLSALACLQANTAGCTAKVWPIVSNIRRYVPKAQGYHIDPPRRDGVAGRFRHDQAGEWVELVKSLTAEHKHVAGKLGPGIDPALLDWADEIEFISENGTLKQAVTWAGRLARNRRSATVIRSDRGQTLRLHTIVSDVPLRTPHARGSLATGLILHEPDSAVVRAGLLGNLAGQIDAALVDPNLPLLVAAQGGDESVFTRRYVVLEKMPWSIKKIKQLMRYRGWQVEAVKTRAFACQPDEILAGLKGLKHTQESPAVVLWAVRLESRPVCILTSRVK